ncbi:MAG: transcriptional repressor [Treponema sp.]|jgi:Fur family peroxide stress response transcriptional regulator|nr:transcriptional repressor [Treponema sp.]
MYRRHSKKREAILELYRRGTSHPGAQWIYEQLKPIFPALSMGTVYRNIRILIDEGVLASVGVINGEERFDGEPLPHAHAVCTCCGTIVDLPDRMEALTVPGFVVDIRNTVLYGLCSECKTKG